MEAFAWDSRSQRTDELYICNAKLACVIKVQKDGKSSLFADSAQAHKLKLPNYAVFRLCLGNLFVSDSGDWSKSSGCIVRFDRRGRGRSFWKAHSLFQMEWRSAPDDRFLFVAQSHTDDVLQVEIREDGSAGDREVYATGLERVPDGLAFDVEGNLYVSCYASDNIYRVSPQRKVELLAYDRDGTTLARPTNIAFGGPQNDELYVANLGRWHINRVKLGVKGQLLANQKK